MYAYRLAALLGRLLWRDCCQTIKKRRCGGAQRHLISFAAVLLSLSGGGRYA